jgi:hypothetical protein
MQVANLVHSWNVDEVLGLGGELAVGAAVTLSAHIAVALSVMSDMIHAQTLWHSFLRLTP